LRLYCDLIVEQVSGIEKAPCGENSLMLTATCKTFLKTLKEAMNLFDNRVKEEQREKVTGFFTPS